MIDNPGQAALFFETCDTGQGWEGCSEYCHPDSTFSAQATVLTDIETIQRYTDWMKNLLTPVPDGHNVIPWGCA